MRCEFVDSMVARMPDDPAELPTPELRELRNDLQRAESGLSFVRRVLQGRLDIVADERDRRQGAAQDTLTVDDSALVATLSASLVRNTRGSGPPRPVQEIEPPAFADAYILQLDGEAPHDVTDVEALDDHQLDELLDWLAETERDISQCRRSLHGDIDALQAETIRRYRSGESRVDDLLTADG